MLVKADGQPVRSGDLEASGRLAGDPLENNYHLISFVPGRGYERHRPGTGKRLSASRWVRFEVHYNPNGRQTTDRTKLGVWFSKVPVTHEMYTRSTGPSLPTETIDGSIFVVEGKEIEPVLQADGTRRRGKLPNIPPYAENWRIVGVTPVTEPITLHALSPHMHVRGKDLTWIITWPDGREETILSVPNYNFNWQLNYELASPLKLPAGSKITAVGHYDNSPRNRYNPAPDKEVYWSDQSWDEMFIPYMEYTIDSQDLTRKNSRRGTQQP